MKAAVLYEYKTPLKVEEVDLEAPKTGEVRVKIVANGICHSDYSVIHGVLRSSTSWSRGPTHWKM